MKKYLLPLILIFALLFVSIGDCAWLSGYDKRIKLTTDNTKVDSTLSNFPVTVFFTSSQAEEVFIEFDADANYMKCAFTQSDGTTQLYAEKELFDVRKSQYPTAHSDTYVKSTTKYSVAQWAYFATDLTLSLTGTSASNEWHAASGTVTNQRFHIDLGSAKVIKKIYYENSHASGIVTNVGVQNFTFWGSNTGAGSFDDLVYANDEGWTQLTCSQNTFDQHTGSDVADPKYITVTNTTGYRYYAFKFADNYGHATIMGVRHIELQGRGEAIYHVKVTSISSSAGTDIYYYYNNSIADNTTYIGAINTTAGGHVWDDNFKAVYHMVDATTSTIVDSTSNNNDGTKASANSPPESPGKVGKAQDFDGSADYIDLGANSSLNVTTILTISACVNSDTAQNSSLLCKAEESSYDEFNYAFRLGADNKAILIVGDQTNWDYGLSTNALVAQDGWYHVAVTWDGSTAKFHKNGILDSSPALSFTAASVATALQMGRKFDPTVPSSDWFLDGDIDELRFSNSVARTAAWMKAEYNSLWDSLLTYGSEESAPSGITWNGVTISKFNTRTISKWNEM